MTTSLENKINHVIETYVANRNVFDEGDFIESKDIIELPSF